MLAVIPSISVAQDTAPLTKQQKLEALRKALGGGRSSESEARPGVRGKKTPPPKPDYLSRALEELKVDDSAYGITQNTPLATVQTRAIESADPVSYEGLRIGLSLQPYQPRGRMPC
ncbi:MAG: hypothetical protein HC902_09175 [Calothrix sp. SM1_5_4]|nr:hypothetical protein [Calothrix sp. SM1_5_4]